MHLTSSIVKVGDVIIYTSPFDSVYIAEVTAISSDDIESRDVHPIASSQLDYLTNSYHWELLAKADSLSALKEHYPEYFI